MKNRFIPNNLTFNITYRCQYSCVFCDVYPMRKFFDQHFCLSDELSLSEVKRIISEAEEYGIKTINLTGGEPFLWKYIYDVINFCEKRRLFLGINTRHIFYPDDLRKLPESHEFLWIWVSLDAHNADLAEKLGRRRGSFEKYISGIKLLIENGFHLLCNIVVNKQNVYHLDELFQLIYDLGIFDVETSEISLATNCVADYQRPQIEKARMLILSKEEKEIAGEQENKWNKRLRFGEAIGKRSNVENKDNKGGLVPRCNILKGIINIRPDGKVIYCDLAHDLTIGDMRKENLGSFLLCQDFLHLIRPSRKQFEGTECYDCHMFETCNLVGRCYKLNKQLHGKLFVPDFKLCYRFIGERGNAY